MARKTNKRMGQRASGTSQRPGANQNNLGASGRVVQISPRRSIIPTSTGLRIRNTEQVDDIGISTSVPNKYIYFIGGEFNFAPWLKQIALAYSRFRIHNLRFYFVGSAASTISGQVTMGFFPDVNDAADWIASAGTTTIWQTTKVTGGHPFSGVGMTPANPMCLSLNSSELHNSMPWYYVGANTESTLVHTIYGGALAVQSDPGSVSSIAGNVFVEYDIEFTQPTPSSTNILARGSSERQHRQLEPIGTVNGTSDVM